MSVIFLEKLEQLEKKKQATYLKLHYTLVEALGHRDAHWLDLLINRYQYHFLQGQIKENGWFYLTIERATELTELGESAQNTRINSLKKQELIECKNMGNPCKRYFKLNFQKIEQLFENDSVVKSAKEQRDDANKSKVIHLPAGRKPKKQSINVPEIEVLENGETGFTKTEELVPPTPRNIYKTVGIESENITLENNKTPYTKTDYSYLEPVHELEKKLPEEIVGKLESTISKHTFQNNKKRYQEFCQYKWVFVKFFNRYKGEVTINGFQYIFDKYLRYEGDITNVYGYLCDLADRKIGKVESQYNGDETHPLYKKEKQFTEQEILHYRYILSTFGGVFPWEHYNKIMDTSLTNEDIAQKREMWVRFKKIKEMAS